LETLKMATDLDPTFQSTLARWITRYRRLRFFLEILIFLGIVTIGLIIVLGFRVWNETALTSNRNEFGAIKTEVENLRATIERKLGDTDRLLDDKLNTAIAGLKIDLMEEIHRARSDLRRAEVPGNGAPCPPAGSQAGSTSPGQPCPDSSLVAGSKSAGEETVREPSAIDTTVRKPLAKWVQLIAPDASCGSLANRKATKGLDENREDEQSASSCFPEILVRAVFRGTHEKCDDVAFRPGTHLAVPMKRRLNPDQKAFEVSLCEGLTQYEDKAVTFLDGSRIGWEGLTKLEQIVVVGDTGCNNDDKLPQDCFDPRGWPFRGIAFAAAGIREGSTMPGLVIHVGDYRYRKSAKGGDNWENWYKDFFEPAEPLLLTAPWVMVRGNHENCYAANGNGWFFLLQPALETVSQCPTGVTREPGVQDADRDPDNQPPYALDLHTKGKTLRMVIVDSANAKYRCRTWVRDFTALYEKRLVTMLNKTDRTVWLLTHYPVWDPGEDYLSDDDGFNKIVKCTSDLQAQATVFLYREKMSAAISEAAKNDGELGLTAVISGDTHNFQFLRVHDLTADEKEILAGSGYHPLQIIAGNGGTKLDPTVGPSGSYTCDANSGPVAYYQRKFIGDRRSFWVAGEAVCSYGYALGRLEGTGGDSWAFSLQPFGRTLVLPACKLGHDDSPCYQMPSGRHCIHLLNKASAPTGSGHPVNECLSKVGR
jgi:hypothetical protein